MVKRAMLIRNEMISTMRKIKWQVSYEMTGGRLKLMTKSFTALVYSTISLNRMTVALNIEAFNARSTFRSSWQSQEVISYRKHGRCRGR